MPGWGMGIGEYDPFAAGPFPVGVRTIQAPDPARGRLFPCETWYPADIGDADRSARPGEERDAAGASRGVPTGCLFALQRRAPAGGHIPVYAPGQSRVRRRRVGPLRGGRARAGSTRRRRPRNGPRGSTPRSPAGFALAGGHAIGIHGILARPSEDVDLFADWLQRADFPAAVDAIIGA